LYLWGFILSVVFFQAEDGIRDWSVTGVQTCALPIFVDGRLGGRGRRCGILPGNQAAINDRKWLPLGNFLKDGTQSLQLILNEEWHNLSEMHFFLFLVGKPSYALPFHKRRTLVCNPMEHARG